MRSVVFVMAVMCVIGASICQVPRVQNLPQQFTANFTIVFPDYVAPTSALSYFGGFFALDYTAGGLKIELSGEEFFPISLHSNVVMSPGQGGITSYIYEGPLCWEADAVPLQILKCFPFQIPENATSLPYKVVNGEECFGWQFEINLFGIVTLVTPGTLWVNIRNNAIVQFVISEIDWAGINSVEFNFFNTVLGPVSPSTFAPPTKANPNLVCRQIRY